MVKYLNIFKNKLFSLTIIFFIIIPIFSCAQNSSKVHPEWSKNAAIYEANIRQHTPEGTFKAFEAHLPQLKDMGIGIVWLMPIQPIGKENRKGSLGSYYSISDYTAVNPEFGTIDDLKSLVNKAHKLGMHVILDWVANHTAWDHPWVKSNPEFYTKDSDGNFVPPVADWSDVIDLNYDNHELRMEMTKSMEFWITNCDIDGFRCDVAAMVPTDFWNSVTNTLTKIKPVFMLAEASEPELQEHAFDMTYGWQFKDLMNDISKGKKSVEDLYDYYKWQKATYSPDDYQMMFTTNHDENSWNGTVKERLGDAVETFAVLTGVVNGMPLVYSGQEAGLDKALKFFEKDTIVWKDNNLRNIYTKLFQLKKTNKALWNGTSGGEMNIIKSSDEKNIFSFTREKNGDKIVSIFNLSPNKTSFSIEDKLLTGSYTNLFSNEKIELKNVQNFELDSWGYIVLTVQQ
ncbi:MAG: alpha-glucosidase C-terminal domain-containing protein [Bacteroidetes bacterium]|nr:alpha-glucosidase C-terminal domain-containing protein [Bacteroidota bacterium]MBU1117183.1 alpha-glucosidase C-terminal domain-containing protein [Bacteroidota bacterium]MBU1798545.1 alpha-glucosidase C-terminal domain-containing protein [Bacteroidota bacterium]